MEMVVEKDKEIPYIYTYWHKVQDAALPPLIREMKNELVGYLTGPDTTPGQKQDIFRLAAMTSHRILTWSKLTGPDKSFSFKEINIALEEKVSRIRFQQLEDHYGKDSKDVQLVCYPAVMGEPECGYTISLGMMFKTDNNFEHAERCLVFVMSPQRLFAFLGKIKGIGIENIASVMPANELLTPERRL